MAGNSRIFVISDMHIPYHHPDTIPFLKAVKEHLMPDRVVCIGDELDYHAMSFHDSDEDLFSAGQELEKSIEYMQEIFKLFPKMDVLDSNHGSLVYRKGKHHGIPRHVLKSYHDILGAPAGWQWHKDLLIETPGKPVYFHHGLGSNCDLVSKNMGMCFVQGHYHSKFKIEYWANTIGLYWSMNIGCMIDDTSYAFAYNKNTYKRPIVGCGMIMDGLPYLLPMVLDKDGRWVKKLM